MVDLSPHITTITLNEPNVSVKRQRSPARIYKKQIYMMLIRSNIKNIRIWKAKQGENIEHLNVNQNKNNMTILMSKTVTLKAKSIIRDKEGNLIMIKCSIHQEKTCFKFVCI